MLGHETVQQRRLRLPALARRGLPAGVATPWKVERRNVASPERMGAFYPAIDLTAGEKERGTLDPRLAPWRS
jgi:hypothetical protein